MAHAILDHNFRRIDEPADAAVLYDFLFLNIITKSEAAVYGQC
jgi:hypothetical protein